MKRLPVVITLALAVVLTLSAGAAAESRTWVAHLSGGSEVPSVDTLSQGQAIFRLNSNGTELYYKLIVANLENTRVSHIHLAPAGVNGGVVVFLYGPELIEGRFSGVLAEGVISDADLIGALAGHPLSHLIEHFESGDAYVNVHTPAYPGGEIRGQIR
ncbi:MAG: CHRD domain-containing protein [Anaerolineae bacterium]